MRRYLGAFGPATLPRRRTGPACIPSVSNRSSGGSSCVASRPRTAPSCSTLPGRRCRSRDARSGQVPADLGREPARHARRAAILPEEHRSKVFSAKTPQSVPTFLVDGRVAGTWSYEKGRVKTKPFRKLTRPPAVSFAERRTAWQSCIWISSGPDAPARDRMSGRRGVDRCMCLGVECSRRRDERSEAVQDPASRQRLLRPPLRGHRALRRLAGATYRADAPAASGLLLEAHDARDFLPQDQGGALLGVGPDAHGGPRGLPGPVDRLEGDLRGEADYHAPVGRRRHPARRRRRRQPRASRSACEEP